MVPLCTVSFAECINIEAASNQKFDGRDSFMYIFEPHQGHVLKIFFQEIRFLAENLNESLDCSLNNIPALSLLDSTLVKNFMLAIIVSF